MKFIIRLSSELTIKSAPVRKRWTKLLADNVRATAKKVHSSARVRIEWDRLELTIFERLAEHEQIPLDAHDAQTHLLLDRLSCIPGVAHFAQVHVTSFETLDDIYQQIHTTYGPLMAGKTFCVRIRRAGKHNFTSADAERYIGGQLHENYPSNGVQLKRPDITLNLEIHDQELYVLEQSHKGLGGYPVGSQEGVLSLISGGFDSTVASFQMIRRGLRTHYCFFSLGGQEHELAVKEIAYYLWQRYGSTCKVRFITVPFEGMVEEITAKIPPSMMGVVLKRCMLKAAEHVCDTAKLDAIVTGEAIAQVSSQTLPNLAAIDTATNKLVLRPLITMDKGEIIDVARKIGAESFCKKVPEYCGVISVNPSANVDLAKVLNAEASLDKQVFERALEGASVRMIDKLMNTFSEERKIIPIDTLALSELPSASVVIDIRHPAERELKPLKRVPQEVLLVPFYALSERAACLDAQRKYYLYCEKGVMSTLHARHLQNSGYTQIGVCRP